ncbi:MAG: hypothetical protein OQL19_03760 [Gammaproteobacteria bacterium]|nr:hypothetical protein [Gammaproteobacteria bacterium]
MLDTLARFQFFFYPLIVHLSVIYEVPYISACLLPIFYLIVAQPFSNYSASGLSRDVSSKNTLKKLLNIKSGIFFLLCFIALFSYYLIDHSVIYLPPLIIISLILYPFLRSVLPGHTPLISRFYQLTEKEDDPQVMYYTEKVTWVWVILIVLILFNTLVLTFFSSLEIWSLFTNFINYILMLILFIAEWLFRMFWFKQWVSPVRFIQQLMTIDQRELLR